MVLHALCAHPLTRVHDITVQHTRPPFAAQTHLVLVMAATGAINDARARAWSA